VITFRCWYCGRRYAVTESRVGERLACGCKHQLKVPKRSGGRCKVMRPVDWLIESVVYGGGGALLGFGLAMLIVARIPLFRLAGRWETVAALTVAGFLFGLLGGERGINWIGRWIRQREEN
jgi:hypothetical protein